MDVAEAVRRRRMVRNFESRSVPRPVLERVLDAARRAPSAGNSQGWAFVVLEGPDETGRFWDVAFPSEQRSSFRFPGVFAAPVLVIPLADAQAYLDRYAEPDKAHTGLGASTDRWPVPYWTVDTSFAVMLLLLAAVDEGLGALFFGMFSGREQLLADLGVPEHLEPLGAVALGWPASDEPGTRGRSASRPRRPLDDVVHWGRW